MRHEHFGVFSIGLYDQVSYHLCRIHVKPFPSRDGYKGISTRKVFTGIAIDVMTDLPIGFKEFCWVVDKDGDNTIKKGVPCHRFEPDVLMVG